MTTETVRLDALVMRLRKAATTDDLAIGDAWNLLDEAADAIEKVFFALDCETECPCCLERIECEDGCTFETDAPDDHNRMILMRETLTHNAVLTGAGQEATGNGVPSHRVRLKT